MVAKKASSGTKKPRKSRAKKRPAKKPGKAGRPEIVVTAEMRERFEIQFGGGMSIEDIAAAMELSPKTLKKHFGGEIKKGRAKKRAETLVAMFKAAIGGNVSAQKAYLQHNQLADADDAAQGAKDSEEAAPTPKAKSVYKGKKEAAQEDAMTAGAGTEWGSDLDPSAPGPEVKPN